MSKVLSTRNAQITTASVEVKILTISGKQVTLAMFRQLREVPLIADDETLNGSPWGTVNYHPDRCGDDEHHIHVIWQLGTDLFRCKVYAPDTAKARTRTFRAGLLVEALIAEGYLTRGYPTYRECRMGNVEIKGIYFSGFFRLSDKTHEVSFIFDGIKFDTRVRNSFYNFYDRPCQEFDTRKLRAAVEAEAGPYESLEELATRLRPTDRYRKLWTTLNDLPHLFIAV